MRVRFNSRAREGRDLQSRTSGKTSFQFQFTRPRGARPEIRVAEHEMAPVQFTRPRGARRSTSSPPSSARVSIHAPARGATRSSAAGPRRRRVSIHAPARGATSHTLMLPSVGLFQFTRPRGARRGRRGCRFRRGGFNSRAREGRDRASHALDPTWAFQFTRPRGARQGGDLHALFPAPVSIHAPARGATRRATARMTDFRFQFTRPRGARLSRCARYRYEERFQFTRPRGARRRTPRRGGALHRVSIHAPARGATFGPCLFDKYNGFNSRAREGRDIRGTEEATGTEVVSIHAPARGATAAMSPASSPMTGFNSRAREGRDEASTRDRETNRRFNSRAREGRDAGVHGTIAHGAAFQFTRPRGARLPGKLFGKPWAVSIHAPARGATREV